MNRREQARAPHRYNASEIILTPRPLFIASLRIVAATSRSRAINARASRSAPAAAIIKTRRRLHYRGRHFSRRRGV